MKFTTLIPTTRNDGTTVKPSVLARLIDSLWRPFGGMTNEGLVTGHWVDEDGTEYRDVCVKVAIECEREYLEASTFRFEPRESANGGVNHQGAGVRQSPPRKRGRPKKAAPGGNGQAELFS